LANAVGVHTIAAARDVIYWGGSRPAGEHRTLFVLQSPVKERVRGRGARARASAEGHAVRYANTSGSHSLRRGTLADLAEGLNPDRP
jgi:hypothetical protein